MTWVADHQVLLAGMVLIALVLTGIAVIVVRSAALMRTARSARQRVEPPVAALSAGLADAERRVGVIADGQVDLEQAIERVGMHTGELRVLIDHAGRALAVLRAPLRYFGR